MDVLNTTTGFRSLRFDADSGMFLNGQHTKVRGFCDHNDFASFGMAGACFGSVAVQGLCSF